MTLTERLTESESFIEHDASRGEWGETGAETRVRNVHREIYIEEIVML